MALDKGVHASTHVLIGTMHGMGAVRGRRAIPSSGSCTPPWTGCGSAGKRRPSEPTEDDWFDAEFVFADENGKRVAWPVEKFPDIAGLGYGFDSLLPMAALATASGGGAAPGAAAPEEAAPETETAAAPPEEEHPHRARALPPGMVGAAPPPPAPPPPARAQAPAAPAASVFSHGPVHVGRAPSGWPSGPRRPNLWQTPRPRP